MQAFKSFMKILNKNRGGIIIYLVIFMVITILFSNLGGNNSVTGFAMKKLEVAVVDRDNTELSKGLKEYIGTNHNLHDIEDTKESMQDNLFYRNVNYVLIIPKGYSEKLSQGKIDNLLENVKVPDSFEGTFIDSQVDQYLKTMSSYLSSGCDAKTSLSLTADNMKQETEVSMANADGAPTEDEPNTLFFFYQYMAFVLISVLLVGLGPILMVFNQVDLKKRIDVSSLSLKKKNRQLILFSVIFSIAVWLAFVVLSIILSGEKAFTTAGLLCMANSFIFTLVCLSITYLVTLLIKSKNAVSSVSNVVGLGMSFLCGVFVPQEVMSASVLNASRILPAYWYMHAHNILMDYTGSSTQIKTICADFGIEFAFAIAIIAISLMVSKAKQNNA